MATRGEQKIDEKKLQKAVESWVKQNRAKIADQRMQAAVDDFVKQHRKEVGDRGMKIIRRVIAEGRTTPTVKSKTPTRGSSLRTEDRRPKVTKQGVEKMVKTATDKSGSSLSKTASRVGKLVKGMTGIGAALTADEVGAGSDVVPEGRRDEFVKKMDAERKAKEKAKAEAQRKKKSDAEIAANRKLAEGIKKGVIDRRTVGDKKKPKTTPSTSTRSVDTKREADMAVAKRRAELKRHNERISKMTPAERKKYRESEAGKRGVLLKNRGGSVSKYSSGGMAQRANCGASMKPTQKSSRGIK